MHPRIAKQLDKLESLKSEILSEISAIDEVHFHYRKGDKWSIAQILTHVVTSERLALSYMKKKSLGIQQAANSGWREPIKLAVLKISQRLPLRYRVPKKIAEQTPEAYSYAELEQRWGLLRIELKSFLENLNEHHTRRLIFKHPIAGMFDAAQGVAFLREHLIHHKPQIRRILRSKQH
jgi:uncharacterized damage-inducible protein DinB